MLSRRQLLAAGAAVVVSGCGASSGSSPAISDDPQPAQSGFTLAQRYPSNLAIPGAVRLPISLASASSLLQTGPEQLHGRVLTEDGKELVTVSAARRSNDIVIPYWAFTPTIEQPGIYTLRVDGDDGLGASFGVFAPQNVTMPHRGSVIQPFDTPTVTDHRGVEPYCTRTPDPCPFHDRTLREVLADGTPFLYMIGTPAHCQTGTCAPGLEFLINAAKSGTTRGVPIIHADVYTDDTATDIAPAVSALGLDYEPVVYVCAGDGTVRDQLDVVWDQSELDEMLARSLS